MRTLFSKFIDWLLSIKRGVIVTDASEAEVNRRIAAVNIDPYGRYIGRATEKGYRLAEKTYRRLAGGLARVSNSFAPVAVAEIKEENGRRHIEYHIRMRWLSLALVVVFRAFFAFALLVGIICGVIGFVELISHGSFDTECLMLFSALPMLLFLEGLVYLAYVLPARRLEEMMSRLVIELLQRIE